MPDAPRIAAWQREVEREQNPHVRIFLKACLDEQIAEMKAANRQSKARRRITREQAQASLEWQKP